MKMLLMLMVPRIHSNKETIDIELQLKDLETFEKARKSQNGEKWRKEEN